MLNRPFEDLFNQSPDQVQLWLGEVASKKIAPPREYNWWLNLAEHAAFQARLAEDTNDEDRLKWAHVAVLVYAYLTVISTGEEKGFPERSNMIFRTNMIARFGAITNHPVLDPIVIERWFFDRLELSTEEARQILDQLTLSTKGQVRKLVEVLDRLAIFEFLIRERQMTDCDELEKWVQLKELYNNRMLLSGQ